MIYILTNYFQRQDPCNSHQRNKHGQIRKKQWKHEVNTRCMIDT